MKLQQLLLNSKKQQKILLSTDNFKSENANLVLAFAQRTLLEKVCPFDLLKEIYPNAQIILCSSSGQVSNNCTIEKGIVVTAIEFDKTKIIATEFDILANNNIDDLGEKIKEELFSKDLKSVLILSEGSFINGTELINELIKRTNKLIPIFGGLAGDEFSFEKTIVGLNANASSGKIVAVGFYGEHIHFGYGSEGGWGDFGPEREVTLSDKNVLYKIGDRFALDLYNLFDEQSDKINKELAAAVTCLDLNRVRHLAQQAITQPGCARQRIVQLQAVALSEQHQIEMEMFEDIGNTDNGRYGKTAGALQIG